MPKEFKSIIEDIKHYKCGKGAWFIKFEDTENFRYKLWGNKEDKLYNVLNKKGIEKFNNILNWEQKKITIFLFFLFCNVFVFLP